MGCDIHFVIEENDGHKWVGIFATDCPFPSNYATCRDPPIWAFKDRNYKFFALLAGCRGEGPDPRGLPKDVSHMAQLYADKWGSDGHSHSHYSLREFISIYLKATHDTEGMAKLAKKKLQGEDPVHELAATLGIYKSETPLDNFRVVFWFDN